MRMRGRGQEDEDFWPAYADILMVTILILIFLVITFVISRTSDAAKREQDQRKATFEQAFEKTLAPEIRKHEISITSPPGERQVITFSNELLFEPGSAELTHPEGLMVLAKVAALLQKFAQGKALFKDVRVDGHTDDDPIHTTQFPSNWQLSSARATSVVYFFANNSIPPKLLSATGFSHYDQYDAEHQPITDKASQRRIEIELLYPLAWLARQEGP